MADFNIALKFKAVNMVTKPLNRIREGLSRLHRVQDRVTASDKNATNAYRRQYSQMRRLIRVTNDLKAAREGLARKMVVAGSASLVAQQAGGVGRGILNPLSQAVGNAAMFEDFETSFSVLLGSTEKAKARISELSDFAATTPFELPEVVQASRVLQTLTDGALATGDELRLLGDVAAGTGEPISELSVHFGRLYDGIQSGRPVGEALARLSEVGAIKGEVRNEIEQMIKSGVQGDIIWQRLRDSFGKYAGMMEKKSGTWNGAVSNLADSWTNLSKTIGDPIKDELKPIIQSLSSFLVKIKQWLDVHPNVAKILGVLMIGGAGVAMAIAGVASAIAVLLPGIGMAQVGYAWLNRQQALFAVSAVRARIAAMLSSVSFRAMGMSALGAGKSLMAAAVGGIRMIISTMLTLGSAAIPALIGAFQTLSVAIMNIPVFGWILAIIALVVFLIYQYWTPIKEFMIGLWEGIAKGVAAAWDWIVNMVKNRIAIVIGVLKFFGRIRTFMLGLWDNIGAGMVAAWDWIVEKVRAYLNWIVSMAEWVKDKFSWLLGDDEKERTATVTKRVNTVAEKTAPLRNAGARRGRRAAQAVAAGAAFSTGVAFAAAPATIQPTPVAPITAAGNSQTTQVNAPITIHAAPGMNEQAVAREVVNQLNERERRANSRRRGRFHD